MHTRLHFIYGVAASLLTLFSSYSSFAQVSITYIQHQQYLDSLISQNQYNEAIDYTLTQTASESKVRWLFVLNRSRAYLKQRNPIDDVEFDCIKAHREIVDHSDSLSIYLDARILELLGHYYYQKAELIHGLNYLDSAAQRYTELQAYDRSIYNLNMIGTIYYLNGKKSKSIQYYQEALRLFTQHPSDSTLYFELLIDLGNLYQSLEQMDKAEEYYSQVYQNPMIRHYPDIQADVFVNLGNISQLKAQTQKAYFYYKSALDTYQYIDDQLNESRVLHNLASLIEDSSSTEALILYEQALEIKRQISDFKGTANTLFSIARIKYEQGNWPESERIAREGLVLSEQYHNPENTSNLYRLLAALSAKQNQWKEAYSFNRMYQEVTDSLDNATQQSEINRLEQLYELEEQQRIIDDLNESKQQSKSQLKKSKIVNYALTGATILLIIVVVLLISNFQQIQRTKGALYTKTLESTAAEALVNGQEQERQRLAHKLHDKVGNHITVLKNRLHTQEAGNEELMRIVQDMSAEVRNISQDLMPPVLERFGLADALEELCARYRDQLEATIDLNVDHSEIIPLNNDDQINLYRLIQELIQYSLFQYNSNYILIELRWNQEGTWLNIEDNGVRKPRELDDTSLTESWKSIEYRVQFLRGVFKRSSHNQGNEYSVHIPKE